MNRSRTTSRSRRRLGAAATELALVLPVLMLLLLGCVDFGRAGYHAVALANASGAAGHYAATHRPTPLSQVDWENQIRQIVAEELAAIPGFQDGDLIVTATAEEEESGDLKLTVQTTYPFRTIVNWPGLPEQAAVSQTVVFRHYR